MAGTRKTTPTSTATIVQVDEKTTIYEPKNSLYEHPNQLEDLKQLEHIDTQASPEALFQQQSEQESYALAVYRLKSRNGRTDTRSGREYLGLIEWSENFEEEIKELFGGGDYVVELRKNGEHKGRRKITIVDEFDELAESQPQPIQPTQQPQVLRPVMFPPQPQSSNDQFKQFLMMMKEAKELAQVQQQTAQINTGVGTLKDLKDNIAEIKAVADMFGSNSNQSNGNSMWENIAMTALAGAVPFAQQAAQKWLNNPQTPTTPIQPTDNGDGTFTLPNGQIVRPVTPNPEQVRQANDNTNDVALSEQTEGEFLDEETEMLIDDLVKEMCDPKHQQGLQQDAVERASNLIKDFREKNPLKAIFINAIIEQDAENVLKQLTALYEPEAAQAFYQLGWILDFINALKTELQKV